MDVPKDAVAVASVSQAHHAEVLSLGAIGTRQCAIDHLIRTMPSTSQPRVCVYAAGPCEYGLYRSLTKQGHVCWVVAPALLPTKAGERAKTTRCDAMPWARLLRSGARTPVSVPQVADAEDNLTSIFTPLLTSEVISTLGVSCCWRQSAARLGSARVTLWAGGWRVPDCPAAQSGIVPFVEGTGNCSTCPPHHNTLTG